MPRKKKEDTAEETLTPEMIEAKTPDEISVEAKSTDDADNAGETAESAVAEEKPTKAKKKAADKTDAAESAEESSIVGNVLGAVASAVGSVANLVVDGATGLVDAITGDTTDDSAKSQKSGKRAEKVGIVASDKMTKTVTVRVDRLVKHQMYRKYVKRRKKFMAHDELGAAVGDRVRIIETRPLSARKRWRVIEIIQKAER